MMNDGQTMTFSIRCLSMSMNAITTLIAAKKYRFQIMGVGYAFFAAPYVTARNIVPVNASTSGQRTDIFSEQLRHFPRNIMQEIMGMLSYALIWALHLGQKLRLGLKMLICSGTLHMTTLRNEPIRQPAVAEATSATATTRGSENKVKPSSPTSRVISHVPFCADSNFFCQLIPGTAFNRIGTSSD